MKSTVHRSAKDIAFIDPLVRVPINSGGDWYAVYLLNELAREHHVTHYYTQHAPDKRGYEPDRVGFNTEALRNGRRWSDLSSRLELLDIVRPDMLWNTTPVRDIRADIVFTNAESYHMARIVARENRAPLVLIMHDVIWQKWKNNGSAFFVPVRAVENHVLRKAAAVIAISRHEYRYARLRVPEDRVFYIPHRIDTSVFNNNGAARYDFGTDKLNVLFYGSLNRVHNIKAARYVVEELVPSLKERGLLSQMNITVIGSGTPPHSLKLDSNPDISFLGEVTDVGPYVRGADVVIVPVRNSSGTKIRVLESLACGTPVVGTPEVVAGLPDHLKPSVYVTSESQGFEEILERFVRGEPPQAGDVTATPDAATSATVHDVVQYVCQVGQ